ncbi:MAG: hypothetical protein HKN76_16730, partial [Saprospiraceae bacterium]|nr:hypothetical protein [Saprospiraceae bacterium]
MLKRCKGIALVLICLLLLWGRSISQQDSILLFVSDNDTYYSEYIVMYEALIASG